MFRVFLIVCISIFLFGYSAQAQVPQIPTNIDFATINVDDITDQQLATLLKQAQASGLTANDIVQQAQAKGMSADNVSKLRERLANLMVSSTIPGGNQGVQNVGQRGYTQTVQNQPPESREAKPKSRIFGADLFTNANLSFEPNLTIPTPAGYIIGAGDQIIVDVFGYSEKSDKLKVSPDGYINIPNVGPVLVSGLTIDEARAKIISRLSSIYSGIRTGNTHVQVQLGDIRSIRVMVIGEVERPGTYTLPSLATVGNALYASGGPGANGSFRNITVSRGGQVIDTFDLYSFISTGNLTGDVLLHDQDVIKVNPYDKRIVLDGQVKHPAIFEVKDQETLGDVIGYAGGYTDRAYTNIIKATRITEKEREVLTIPKAQVGTYALQSGDSLYVDSVLDRLSNKVTILGDVFFPGSYALKPGMTVKDLIGAADGVKEDVFMNKGLINRRKQDFSPEAVDFNVGDVLSGSAVVPLQAHDTVFLYSKSEIHQRYYIYVQGEVNHADSIPFAEGMRLGDAILQAGGFRDAASLKEIEVARRTRSQVYDPKDKATAIVENFSLPGDFNSKDDTTAAFVLQPFDRITVRRAPGYGEQASVKIEGEVVYPGDYVMVSKDERLSDLVKRTGGLKTDAYVDGAMMLRKRNSDDVDRILEQNELEIFKQTNQGNDSLEIARLGKTGTYDYQLVDINLRKALESPGSEYDMILQKDDIIRVPLRLETVTVNGEVFYPKKIRYDKSYSFKDFVLQAGGFTSTALRRRSYIVYPNGEVHATKKILFINRFPKVRPGSEIFVPAKKKKSATTTGEVIALTTGLAALLGIIISIINITK